MAAVKSEVDAEAAAAAAAAAEAARATSAPAKWIVDVGVRCGCGWRLATGSFGHEN